MSNSADVRRYSLYNPTDSDVLDALDDIKRAYRSAQTRVSKKLKRAEHEAFARFGSSDVEHAARGNSIRRAEVEAEQSLSKARHTMLARLRLVRQSAGIWADLVPEYFDG